MKSEFEFGFDERLIRRSGWMKRIATALLMASVLIPCAIVFPSLRQVPGGPAAMSDAVESKGELLEVFEVYSEPAAPGKLVAESVVMEHTFAFSYGRPFVGTYKPPGVNFTHVHLKLSTTSHGRQFDRLALVFLGDHELWRTSTAEPTQDGIHFQYVKDVTRYLALLREENPFIFEMGNLVDETYTGKFNMKLTAVYYHAANVESKDEPADTIVAVSARRKGAKKPSHFSLPQDRASTSVTLSPAVYKATVLVSASGNAAEEFWYANVVSEFKDAFPGLDGNGPHREVQVWVGGRLAGAAFPFPTIYTGGISPGLWRPIVGIGAYDVPMYEFDLTPVLPLLWEGAEVEIRVETGEEPIEHDWIVSGNIFAWTGEVPGTGEIVEYDVQPLKVESAGSRDATTLNVTSVAEREGVIRSVLRFAEPRHVFTNFSSRSHSVQRYARGGQQQRVLARINGTESSSALGGRVFEYPLDVDSMYEFAPVLRIAADVKRGLAVETDSSAVWTDQTGSSYYIGQGADGSGPYGGGSTEQAYVSSAPDDQYWRTVRAVNGGVIRDLEIRNGVRHETVGVAGTREFYPLCLEEYNARVKAGEVVAPEQDEGVKRCIRRMLGRRPL